MPTPRSSPSATSPVMPMHPDDPDSEVWAEAETVEESDPARPWDERTHIDRND